MSEGGRERERERERDRERGGGGGGGEEREEGMISIPSRMVHPLFHNK